MEMKVICLDVVEKQQNEEEGDKKKGYFIKDNVQQIIIPVTFPFFSSPNIYLL